MWDVPACRCCLARNCKLIRMSDTNKRFFEMITSLEVKPGDGYPAYFCVECNTMVKKTLAFRRKCRRAYFAMKAIMVANKQISFNDIKKVNRKVHNLVSSNQYWLPNNSGFFIVPFLQDDNTEEDSNFNDKLKRVLLESQVITQEPIEDKKPDIIKYDPEINNNNYIITDIKPDNYKEIEEEELRLQEITYDTNIDESSNNNDEDLEGNAEEIDLDDVFKGLEFDEKSEDSDDNMDYVEPVLDTQDMVDGKHGKKDTKPSDDISLKRFCETLLRCTLKVLPPEQRTTTYAERRLAEPYRAAVYKCAVCVCTLPDIERLVEHVAKHNRYKQVKDYVCSICSYHLGNEQELNQHMCENHTYTFTCNTCKLTRYTFLEIYQHLSEQHENEIKRKLPVVNVDKKFRVVPLSPRAMYAYDTSRMPYKCTQCAYRAKTLAELGRHKKLHYQVKNKRVYECDICKKLIIHPSLIRKHIMDYHLYTYHCKRCKSVFKDRVSAARHNNCKSNTCHICNKVFQDSLETNKNNVPSSSSTNTSEGPVDFVFSISDNGPITEENNMTTLYKHRQEHRAERLKWHCLTCGGAFFSQRTCYSHQLKKHSTFYIPDPALGSPEFKCEHCDVQFMNQRALMNHQMKMSHEEAKYIESACQPCRRIFDTEQEKAEHMEVCRWIPSKNRLLDQTTDKSLISDADNINKNYSFIVSQKLCELCGAVLTTSAYRKHMLKHLSRTNAITCSYCSEKLNNKSAYILHVLLHHTEKPYECVICNTKYVYRRFCMDHILRRHAPCLPFACEFCSREFAHPDYLVHHCKRQHNADLRPAVRDKYKMALIKMQGKVYIYPHMRLDLSHVDSVYLDGLELYISDYKSENLTLVDNYKDYIITDSTCPPILSRVKPQTEKKTPKTNMEYKHRLKNIKTDPDLVQTLNDDRNFIIKSYNEVKTEKIEKTEVNDYEEILECADDFAMRKETEIEEVTKTKEATEMSEKGTETAEDNTETTNAAKYLEQIEEQEIYEEYLEDEDNKDIEGQEKLALEGVSFVGEGGEEYQLIEEDGEQYVLINGELYKVAVDG